MATTTKTITVTENTCERCGHKWTQKLASTPRVCPSCKSPYWNKPRQHEMAKTGKKGKISKRR